MFGKFKGQSIKSVPRDYLRYLLKWDGLRQEMRDAIEQTLRGTCVPPVAVTGRQPPRSTYEPLDIRDRITRAIRTGARWAIHDAGQETEALEMPEEYKSMIFDMLLSVASRLQSEKSA